MSQKEKEKELLKKGSKIYQKAQSSNKTDLNFRKKNEHIQIDSKKSKENNEKYNNPLVERKYNNTKPKGLYNLGLNCYMNSLLQCLYNCQKQEGPVCIQPKIFLPIRSFGKC